MKDVDKELVVQSNKVIEASYKLTLQEKRLIYMLLTKIHKDDEDFKPYEFSVIEIAKLLEIPKSNLYRDLIPITKDLMSKVLSIRENDGILQVNWFSSVKYFTGMGKITLKFAPELKPYLLKLKENFTKIEIANVIKLNSFYSIRIYELLKQFKNIKQRELGLINLKEILGIKELKAYSLYSNFKQRILKLSVNEINEKTDLLIDFDELKSGRKVYAIKFKIALKQQEEISIPEEDLIIKDEYSEDVLELFNLLPESEKIEIRKEQLNQHLKQHSFEMLKEDILYCCGKNIEKDFWGYFESSLKHGHYSKAEFEKKKAKEKKELEKNKQEIELKNTKTEFEKYFSDYCMEIFLHLNDYEKSDYEKVYNASPVKKRVSFEKFTFEKIKEHFQNEIDDVCNPDDFEEQKSFLEHMKKVRDMRPEF